MMNRTIVVILAVSSLAFVALALRQCSAPQSRTQKTGGLKTTKSPIISEQTKAPVNRQLPPGGIPRPQTPEDVLYRHNVGASGFDTKVRFWGKVLDQDGNPVDGVSIRASVTTLRMIKTEKGYREFEILDTQSKTDGSFMLDGAQGFALTIEKLTKPGYVLPSPYQEAMSFPEEAKYRYPYAPMAGDKRIFHPNKAFPVIYRLWKLKNPEPLMMWGSWAGYQGPKYQLNDHAKSHSMAFVPGSQRKNAPDISIAVNSVGTEKSPQWEVVVTAVEDHGGVAKADPNDPFMFEAPAQGYKQVQNFQYGPQDADQYNKGESVRFFVRSKNGRWHSAVDLVFFAPDSTGKIATKWRNWVNPNGSRNLEHDSAHPIFYEGF